MMRIWEVKRRIAGLILAFVATVTFGQLLICQRCGYENEVGSAICTHCSGSFPVQQEVPEASPLDEEIEDSENGHLPEQFVLAEIEEGQRHLKDLNYELARLFFLNALALEVVTAPAEQSDRSENLLEMIRSAESAARIVRKACPHCGGRGRTHVVFEGLDLRSRASAFGSDRSFTVEGHAGIACKACEGSGAVYVEGTVAELMVARRAATSTYIQYQQARRLASLGGVWVPSHVMETLSVRKKAMLMRSIALPCESCIGYGKADCRHCVGLGHIPCRNCQEGRVSERRAGDRVQRIGADRTRPCEVCGATGNLPCRDCRAEGTRACRGCGGAGIADACRACEARGYVTCRRCRGTKVHRGAACPACKSEGHTICASCNGRGRRN